MKFYINTFNPPESDWNHCCVGLFTNNKWDGRGSFCGYYGAEYYLDTDLLAYGIQCRNGGMRIDLKAPFDGGFKVFTPQHFSEICIGSGMWEKSFEANSAEEAIDIFKRQAW
jgi:hypothetical protein